MPDPVPSTRVNRLWRTLAIGLMLGITAHAALNRQAPVSATPPLTIRADPLPPPDPRLDAMLDSHYGSMVVVEHTPQVQQTNERMIHLLNGEP